VIIPSRMSLVLILIACFVAVSLAVEDVDRSDLIAFDSFMNKYNKSYASDVEKAFRFGIFQQNIKVAGIYSRESRFAKFGATKFSDLTREEFQSKWLMTKYPAAGLATSCLANGVGHRPYPRSTVNDVPTSWDWRTKGVVTGVKNQQECGSCWTFSTTGNIEGLWALKGNKLTSFSEQEIVDCSTACCNVPGYGNVCNQGCNGGFQWNAFYDIISWGGLETESMYPYNGYPSPSCLKAGKQMAPIKNYTCLSNAQGPADEGQMAAYCQANGPISIALNAALLMNYDGGIIDPFFPNFWCDPNSLDHALLIVGWGQGENWIGETIDYWLVKNSWGTDWGESGYFRIGRGVNLCGIANSVVAANM